jgi:hypothetical protein
MIAMYYEVTSSQVRRRSVLNFASCLAFHVFLLLLAQCTDHTTGGNAPPLFSNHALVRAAWPRESKRQIAAHDPVPGVRRALKPGYETDIL